MAASTSAAVAGAAGTASSSSATAASVYNVEGLQAGRFAGVLAKQREDKHAEFERKKAELERAAAKPVIVALADKFVASSQSQVDAMVAAKTVGLMSIAQMLEAREEVERAARMGVAPSVPAAPPRDTASRSGGAGASAGTKRPRPVTLSFMDELDGDGDGDGDGRAAAASTRGAASTAADATTLAVQSSAEADSSSGAEPPARSRPGKDPTVATDFLPDAARDRELAELKERLRDEWLREQERLKAEKIEVVYSWWDGTGHRRSIRVPRGTSITRFLEWVRQDLLPEFPALRSLSGDNLMYVKEDLIIPGNYTFHELITNRARGKSGPLFDFGVHADVRLLSDARVEKDESHPGKIVERRWYERNKHIFPCSRWEIYDPAKRYDTYTTHGHEVNAKPGK